MHLNRLFETIAPLAEENSMEAFIVKSPARLDQNSMQWIPDGSLLKLCPMGARDHVLLEIDSGYRIYAHRTPDLTAKHQGQRISVQWVKGFIEANGKIAESISKEAATRVQEESPDVPAPNRLAHDPETLKKLRSQIITVDCHCGGMTDRCGYCFGRGKYETDGLGNRL